MKQRLFSFRRNAHGLRTARCDATRNVKTYRDTNAHATTVHDTTGHEMMNQLVQYLQHHLHRINQCVQQLRANGNQSYHLLFHLNQHHLRKRLSAVS